MASVSVVKGDWGYYLNFNVTYSSGSAYDLTAQTVTLKISDPSSSTVLITVPCDIVNATSGQCRYLMSVTNSLLLQCQIYKAELEIKAGSATTFTVPNLYIKVVTDMPAG